MATTPNYAWTTPDDTNLVKNGASDIRTLANAIDSTVKTNADAAVLKTIVDAKGDLLAGTAADTISRLAVGANGTVLTADSGETTGLKWVTPSGPTEGLTLINTGGTALTGATTITVSGLNSYRKLLILINGASSVNASSEFSLRFNSDSANNYAHNTNYLVAGASYATSFFQSVSSTGQNALFLAGMGSSAGNTVSGGIFVHGTNETTPVKAFTYNASTDNAAGSGGYARWGHGFYKGTNISSVSLISSSGNFDAGTLFIYGV